MLWLSCGTRGRRWHIPVGPSDVAEQPWIPAMVSVTPLPFGSVNRESERKRGKDRGREQSIEKRKGQERENRGAPMVGRRRVAVMVGRGEQAKLDCGNGEHGFSGAPTWAGLWLEQCISELSTGGGWHQRCSAQFSECTRELELKFPSGGSDPRLCWLSFCCAVNDGLRWCSQAVAVCAKMEGRLYDSLILRALASAPMMTRLCFVSVDLIQLDPTVESSLDPVP